MGTKNPPQTERLVTDEDTDEPFVSILVYTSFNRLQLAKMKM